MRPEVRRKRHSGNTPSTGTSDARSGSQFESSGQQSSWGTSDYTSSFQARQTAVLEPKASTSKVQGSVQSSTVNTTTVKELKTSASDEIVMIPFEESLSSVHVDCDNTCDHDNHDIVTLPLISRQCDDILDTDGEIFCDSNDLRDMYRLEADV